MQRNAAGRAENGFVQWFRKGKGDFILGCFMQFEWSALFTNLRAILSEVTTCILLHAWICIRTGWPTSIPGAFIVAATLPNMSQFWKKFTHIRRFNFDFLEVSRKSTARC